MYLMTLHTEFVKPVVNTVLTKYLFFIVGLACRMYVERAGRWLHVNKRSEAKVAKGAKVRTRVLANILCSLGIRLVRKINVVAVIVSLSICSRTLFLLVDNNIIVITIRYPKARLFRQLLEIITVFEFYNKLSAIIFRYIVECPDSVNVFKVKVSKHWCIRVPRN